MIVIVVHIYIYIYIYCTAQDRKTSIKLMEKALDQYVISGLGETFLNSINSYTFILRKK